MPFADAVSRKPCLKVPRLTAPTAIRIFDNSTPSSSRTAFDAKGLADASPRRLCFQPSKAGCISDVRSATLRLLHLACVPANPARFPQQQLLLPLLQLGGDERVYNTLRKRYNWTTFSYNGHELGGVYYTYLELVTRHKSQVASY